MDRSKTKELLDTIENQKEQINRYEVRLRDIVHAYKSLLKEKEALEASVKVLSSASQQERSGAPRSAPRDDPKKEEDVGGDGGEQQEGTDAGEDESSDNELGQQLATLSSSLATLTAEKSKMEASFQADKKKIRQETEETLQRLSDEKTGLEDRVTDLDAQLTDARNRLRTQQQEREQEQVDHAVMLRELQALLAQERTNRERLDHKIEELEESLVKAKAQPDNSHVYEEQIMKLTSELEMTQRKLITAHEEAARPPPLLLQLQKDMAEMKAQHRIQVESEQQKSREAAERLAQAREMEEERVTALEAKLAGLSEVVGNYDRVRQQDQMAIQKLKERVTQLDLENSALARAANSSSVANIEESSDPAEIKEVILKLKALLKLANEKSEKPVDIDDIGSLDDDTSREHNPDHKACQQELKQLKEEFERYKVRAQTVLKNRNVKDTTNNKEIEELQAQMNEYKERVSILRQQLDDEETKQQETEKNTQTQMTKLREQHKQQLQLAEGEFKQKIADLEHQVGKQRDRTMALLVDKDKEVEHLKQQLQQYTGRTYGDTGHTDRQSSLESDVFAGDDLGASGEPGAIGTDSVVSQLISNPATQLAASSGGSLLHYAEEQARREVEMTMVKRQKQQLETALRQLQDKHSSTNEKHMEEVEALQEEVERWKRNRSREGTNMEYLKNVVLNYLLTDSVSGKKRMFNAISTILHFSPKEKDSILKKTSSAWWSGV